MMKCNYSNNLLQQQKTECHPSQNTLSSVLKCTRFYRLAVKKMYELLPLLIAPRGINYLLPLLGIVTVSSIGDTASLKKGASKISLGDAQPNPPTELKRKNISEIMCTRTQAQAFDILDFLSHINLLNYTVEPQKIVIQLIEPEKYFYNKSGSGRKYEKGYFLLPKEVRDLFAGCMGEMDSLIDLYCSSVVMDPDFHSSLYYPTVCLDHNGLKSTEPKDFCFMSELADRWGLGSRSSVIKRIYKYVRLNYISYYPADTGWGGIILPTRYYEFFDYVLDHYGNYKVSFENPTPPTPEALMGLLNLSHRKNHKDVSSLSVHSSTTELSVETSLLKEQVKYF